MSGIATGTALMIGGGLAAGGSIAAGALGANAAGNAASTQAQAANNAAQLQYQLGQQQLGFQQQEWGQQQANIAPWLQSGGGALNQLDYLLGVTPNTSLGYQSSVPQLGGTAKTPTFGAPQGNAALSTPSAGSINNGLTGPTSQLTGRTGPVGVAPSGSSIASGVTPSGTPQLPIGVPRTDPVTGIGGGVNQAAGISGAQGGSPAGGFGSLLAPYGQTFSAPTEADMIAHDPGYQARLNLGEQAYQQSAAARGNLLTGGSVQGMNQLAQDYASNEYNNFYNQAYNTYAQNYNQWAQQQSNVYNRLAAMAGVGQTAAGQLGSLGQSAVNSTGNTLGNLGASIGQQYNNAGAANASGLIGSANAWGGALGSAGNSLQNMLLLKQLYGGGATQNWLNNATSDGMAAI